MRQSCAVALPARRVGHMILPSRANSRCPPSKSSLSATLTTTRLESRWKGTTSSCVPFSAARRRSLNVARTAAGSAPSACSCCLPRSSMLRIASVPTRAPSSSSAMSSFRSRGASGEALELSWSSMCSTSWARCGPSSSGVLSSRNGAMLPMAASGLAKGGGGGPAAAATTLATSVGEALVAA